MNQPRESTIGGIILRLLFSLVYTGVVIYFYYTLSHIDGIVGQKCDLAFITVPTITSDFKNFCDHIITWKTCGLFGIVFPGFIEFVLSLFVLFKTKHQSKCYQLWKVYEYFTAMINFGILVILWKTRITSTHIGDTNLLETAATILMIVLGLDALVNAIFLLSIMCFYCCCIDLETQNVDHAQV